MGSEGERAKVNSDTANCCICWIQTVSIDYRLRHKGKLRLSKKPVPKPRSTHKETGNDYTDVEMICVEADEKTEDYFEDSDLMGVYVAKGLIVWYYSMKCCVSCSWSEKEGHSCSPVWSTCDPDASEQGQRL